MIVSLALNIAALNMLAPNMFGQTINDKTYSTIEDKPKDTQEDGLIQEPNIFEKNFPREECIAFGKSFLGLLALLFIVFCILFAGAGNPAVEGFCKFLVFLFMAWFIIAEIYFIAKLIIPLVVICVIVGGVFSSGSSGKTREEKIDEMYEHFRDR